MKLSAVILVMIVIFMPLLTSCSVRQGAPLKAGFEPEDQGWLSRNVPGIKKLSDIIPPPTEARQKWEEQRKQSRWSQDGAL